MTVDSGAGGDQRPEEIVVGGWAEEARAEAAAAARRRARWISQRAVEEATLADILAAGGAEVIVHTAVGRHRGTVAEVGLDYVAVATAAGPVYIRSAAVTTVEVAAGRRPVGAPRRRDVSIGAALAAEVTEDRIVAVATAGPSARGELAAVGEDFLLLQAETDGRRAMYVPLAALVSVTLLG